MKAYLTGLVVLLVVGTGASDALAGFANPAQEVTFEISGKAVTASGLLTSVRNSRDGKQEIGCQVSTSVSSNGMVSNYLTCSAIDSTGKMAACSSTNGALVSAARGITSDSWIAFSINTGTIGNCASLTIRKYSSYLQ